MPSRRQRHMPSLFSAISFSAGREDHSRYRVDALHFGFNTSITLRSEPLKALQLLLHSASLFLRARAMRDEGHSPCQCTTPTPAGRA